MKEAWSTPLDPHATPESSHDARNYWVTDEIIVAWIHGTLRGYDTESGKQRWKLRPPKGSDSVCAVSTGLGAKEVGGVVFADGKGVCARPGAVEARTGKVLWTARTAPQARAGDRPNSSVSVGEKVLGLQQDCGDVLRFRLSDGKRLSSPLQGSAACVRNDAPSNDDRIKRVHVSGAAHNGRHIAVCEHCGSGERGGPDPELVLYDQDSGRELWRRKEFAVRQVHGIVADDPVTLETTEDANRRLRGYGPDGKRLRVVGDDLEFKGSEEQSAYDGEQGRQSFSADGVFLDGLGGKKTGLLGPAAYELRTGKRLWSAREPMEREVSWAVGTHDGKILMTRRTRSKDFPSGRHRVTFYSHGLRDGARRALGRTGWGEESFAPLILDGRRLYAVERRNLVAYELPPL